MSTTLVIRTFEHPNADPRLIRTLTRLTKNTSNIKFILLTPCTKRNDCNVSIKNVNHVKIRTPASIPRALKRILSLVLTQSAALYYIIRHKPSIVYVVNYDSGITPLILSNLLKYKIVFDIYDYYHMLVKNRILKKIIYKIEYNIAKKSSLIIIPPNRDPSKIFNDTTLRSKTIIIPNSPLPEHIQQITTSYTKIEKLLKKYKIKYSENTIIYTGSINRIRGIHYLAKATHELDIQLILAGNVTDYKTLNQVLNNYNNVSYIGILNYEDSLLLQSLNRVNIALYDPSIPIHRLADPNKVYESILLEKPILTNIYIHKYSKCLIHTDYSYESIKKSLEKIFYDTDYYNKIVSQCKEYKHHLVKEIETAYERLSREYSRLASIG